MKQTLEARAREVLETILAVAKPEGDIVRETTPEWDSIKNIEVVFALEDAFSVRIPEKDIARLVSLSAIVRVLEEHHAT